MTSTPRRPALSMLDLVAVREGGTVAHALQIALRTAQHAEKLGFARYWLAEHHNMAGIASSATAVLVGHIAGGTCLLYTSPSPRDLSTSRMPSSA